MKEVTTHLRDDLYEALEDAAAAWGISIPEYAAILLTNGLNNQTGEKRLSWQAEDLLKALKNFRARPGMRINSDTLYQLWVNLGGLRKPEDLQIAADELGDRDFADVDANSVTLTDAGYRKMNS